jgi:general secretion pathway protein J
VQLAPRPVRQPVGDNTWLPALQGDPANQPFITLTRNGWTNPTGLQRPGLQRVAYSFDIATGTLRREYWTVLDATLANTTIKRDIMTHLKSVAVRYMDVSKQWQTQWPPTGVQGATGQELTLRQRPIAVEITLETEDWGKVQRIVEVAG